MVSSDTIRSVRKLEDQRHVLDALLRALLSKNVLNQHDLDAVLSITIRKVCDTISAQAVMAAMLDLTGQHVCMEQIYFSPSLYIRDEELRHVYLERAKRQSHKPLPCHRFSEVWQRLAQGESVRVDDPVIYPDLCAQLHAVTGLEVRSLVAVPLVIDGTIVGCLEAVNKCADGRHITAFSEEDVALLADVAGYSAKVLKRLQNPGAVLNGRETAEYLARLTKFQPIDLRNDWQADLALLNKASEMKLRHYRILPLARMADGNVSVALPNPLDLQAISDFELVTGMKVGERRVAPVEEILAAIDRAFPRATPIQAAADSVHKSFESLGTHPEVLLRDEESSQSAPIIQLANRIIEDAYQAGASDIHVEPQEGKLLVRYRIDGVCRIKLTLPPQAHAPLVCRFKIMSDLDIAEHRLPQDGRLIFKRFSPEFDLDLRVSIMPTNHGENVVMRILDKKRSTLPLDKLGFSTYNIELYRRLLKTPYGMVLHCGPTGSGKSMTLYAALNEINSPELKILTAEDPIEYTLPQINQIQVKREIGLTFASCLRSFLRQDPDIILVGEIRDRETAEIAVEASLTGHLLFSTLHTNDAPSTITRLVEIGVEPFLISSTLVAICAQRLVRRVCACHKPTPPTPEEFELLARARDAAAIGNIARPAGCHKCDQTGYKGRTGIHELLECTDAVRELITRGASNLDLKRNARKHGMRTLFEDAMEKVKAGITTLPEALSIACPDEDAAPAK